MHFFSPFIPIPVASIKAILHRHLRQVLTVILLCSGISSLPCSGVGAAEIASSGPISQQSAASAPQPAAKTLLAESVGMLTLKDGRQLLGQLSGLTTFQLTWTVPTGETVSIPLTMVEKIDVKPIKEKVVPLEESPLIKPEEMFSGPSAQGLIEPIDQSEISEEPAALPEEELAAAEASASSTADDDDGAEKQSAEDVDTEAEDALFQLTQWEETVVAPLPEPVTFSYRFSRQQMKAWTKRFEIGARFLDGNSEEKTINSEARFENRYSDYTTRIDMGAKWGRARDVQISNQLFANANMDFGEVGSWIFFVTNQNQYDELQDLDYRGTLSAGVGYRFLDDEERRFITRLGPGVTAEEYSTPGNDRVTADIFAEAELQWPLFDRTHFESKSTIRPSIEDYEVFRFTNDMAVLVQLDEQSSWQFKLGVKQEYNSAPAALKKKSDFTTVFQLVYTLK
ncbi:hypothetical protein Pla110_31790 [Polystyrenella longa]|uniref:DUF481 domain-containing protein n=1 Tax=Polystyrenella longa TaxID=2528007 RepID=A0A518CQD2_9PLAN|nr:DUF481 domain-containing protein [Polystyrenella longa]QDU81438.1 hypothetical protein Pla110_31790 [Polystyrenella longa]